MTVSLGLQHTNSQMAVDSGLIFLLLLGLEGPHLNITRAVPYLCLQNGVQAVTPQLCKSPLPSDVLLPQLQAGGTDAEPSALMPEAGTNVCWRRFLSEWSQGDFNVEVFFHRTQLIVKPGGWHTMWNNSSCCSLLNCHLLNLHSCWFGVCSVLDIL